MSKSRRAALLRRAIRGLGVVGLAAGLAGAAAGPSPAAGRRQAAERRARFEGRIAFLRNGEIWTADADGRDAAPVTKTGSRVEAFLFSPSLEYVAVSRRIKTVEEPGLWEEGETPPLRSVCSIVILELEGLGPRGTVDPPDGEWVYPDKWLPGGRLLGHRASGFDVSGFFAFDVPTGRTAELDYDEGSRLLGSDFSADGAVQAFTRDSGVGPSYRVDLFLADLRTGRQDLVLSKRSVLDPKISPDKAKIAFFEVDFGGKEGFDTLWVHDLRAGRLREIYHGPAKPKTGGVSDLAWSPDGRRLAVAFLSEIRVFQVEDPDRPLVIPGRDLSWITNDRVIFARGASVYGRELGSGKTELLLENAGMPVFLAGPK